MQILRGLFIALVGTLATLGSSQIVWQHTVADTTSAQLIRDSSSNLYFVTRTATLQGRRLTIRKSNALGTEVWTRSFVVQDDVAHQNFITGVAINATHLAIAYEVRTLSSNAFQSGRVLVIRLSDGELELQVLNPNARVDAIDINSNTLAVLTRNSMTNAGQIWFFSAVTFNSTGTQGVGTYERTAGVKLDGDGNAFAVYGLANGTIEAVKATTSGILFQTQHDRAGVTDEVPTHLGLDTSVNRLYALGYGQFSLTDRDTFMYNIDATTGATVSIGAARNTTENEQTGDLLVLPGAGVLVSVVTSSSGRTSLVRRNPAGSQTLSVDIDGAATTTNRRALARDPLGNYVVCEPSGMTGRLSRVDSTNGNLRGQLLFPLDGFGNPNQMVMDSAGNCYVYWDGSAVVRLARVQHGTLSFSGTNLTGGTPATGTITLPGPADGAQEWNLQSSNPAAASVPATVTINNGATTANFPITISGVAANTNVAINASFNGFIMQRTITLVPSNMQSVQVNQNVVVGGTGIVGTANLNGIAPSGGRTVTLTSNKPTVAQVDANIVIPQGAASANFAITTSGVNANQGVVITATTGAVSKTVFIAVNAPSLTTISLNPGTIKGGLNSSLTLNINGLAPTGGFAIVLISGAPGLVTLPATGTVPAGNTTVNVNVITSAVTATTNVTVFATRSGIYKTAQLTLTP